jgi:hypothetical protein
LRQIGTPSEQVVHVEACRAQHTYSWKNVYANNNKTATTTTTTTTTTTKMLQYNLSASKMTPKMAEKNANMVKYLGQKKPEIEI